MSKHGRGREDCSFFTLPIEPLAFYLPPFGDVNQQKQCPLYDVLPKEIRDIIFEYVLCDDDAPSHASENSFERDRRTVTDIAKTGDACALLRTCKAVYIEAYRIPMLVNGKLPLYHHAEVITTSLC